MGSSVPRIVDVRTTGLKRNPTSKVTSTRNTDTLVEISTDASLVGRGSCSFGPPARRSATTATSWSIPADRSSSGRTA